MAYTAQHSKHYSEALIAIERLLDRDLAMLIADMLSGGIDMSDDLSDLCFDNGADKLSTALAEYANNDEPQTDVFGNVFGSRAAAIASRDFDLERVA